MKARSNFRGICYNQFPMVSGEEVETFGSAIAQGFIGKEILYETGKCMDAAQEVEEILKPIIAGTAWRMGFYVYENYQSVRKIGFHIIPEIYTEKERVVFNVSQLLYLSFTLAI